MLQQLHLRAQRTVRNLHNSERELIPIIQAFEREKGYLSMGYPSLFVYLARGLGLSEGITYHAIKVARRAAEVPRFQQALRKGEITLSKAKVICSVITEENAEEWLRHAKELPTRELEKKVAETRPDTERTERARYKANDHVELTVSLTNNTMELLKRAQEVASQKNKLPLNFAAVFHEIADAYLERHDPLRKAKRSQANKDPEAEAKAEPTPANARQEAVLRDLAECQFVMDDGNICGARVFVELHHIVPKSEGGSDEAENLVVLCSAHHQLVHAPPNLH